MPIQRARTVDVLYDAVAEYDLVLVPDAPLASAINRRLDVPHFGTFATTPRRLAAGRREQAEDRTAFLEVIDRTTYDWKSVSYAIGNVLQCWEHQGSLDSILEYDQYADEVTREVVDILGDLRTTSSRLSEHTIHGADVAVVGESLLTDLERRVLPDEYESIPLFADEPFDPPPMHIIDTSGDIIDALLDAIDPDTPDRVAIVLEGTSRYSSLVESALEANDIPYVGGPGFVDDPHIRSYITLCRLAFRGADTTVADVRSILTRLGASVDIEHDEKRLHAVDIPETAWIRSFCRSLTSRTFTESLDVFADRIGASMDRFRSELRKLGIASTPVTADRLDELTYYLQSYDVPVTRENTGVLLADATSSGYVDRPVVFHLGLDESWTRSPPQRPWVNAEAQFERYIGQFQLLLQSGVNQYYLVTDTAGGQPVTPCLYFGELFDEEYDQFSDLESVAHTRPGDVGRAGFDRVETDIEPGESTTISNSRLTTYINSPRDYFFDQLVDGPSKDYFREGNLFHDFAEFYVTHPEAVDDATIGEVVVLMLDDAAPFFAEIDRPLRRRKYRIGLETIVEYLDTQRPFEDDFLTPSTGWGSNFFAEYYGKSVDSPLTEHWFEDSSLGMNGKIDLIAGPDHLLDFKSGPKKSRRDVVKQAAIDPPDDRPDFQAAMYLCYYRSERPEEPLEFTFFHFLDTLDDVISGSHDIEDTLTTVSYYPWTFDEYVGSRDAYDVLLDGYADCASTFEDLGFESYRDIMEGLQFPDTTDRAVLRESDFCAEFTNAVDRQTSAEPDVEKGTDQAIRLLNGIHKKTFFREDLDAFETFVTDRIEELDRYRAGEERFPIEGLGGEPNYRRVSHRDLLLEGETR
ncbi:MAG: PD-(D/E)XK nuclease family protein [Natronomonas sp.]